MNLPLTLKQLRYLVAVAESLHFGRAATACNISQPSLSAQIQGLEQALGVKVFERSNRRVEVTPTGEILVAQARRVLAEAEALVVAAHEAAAPLTGPFRLGVIPTLAPYLLPRILPALRRAHAELRLYLREDLTDRLLARLEQGALDAALLALPPGRADVEALALFDEPFLLATPPGHRLAASAPVDRGALAAEHLLLLEDGHCLRDQALELCRLAGAADQDRFGATSLETLREMVAGGLGVTVIPALAAERISRDRAIALARFADPPPSRRIGLVWRRTAARGADIRALGGFLRGHLPPGVAPAN